MASIRQSLQPGALVLIQSNVEEVTLYMEELFLEPQIPDACQIEAVSYDARQGECSMPHIHRIPRLANPFAAQSETEAMTTATGRDIWRSLLRAV